MNKEEAKKKIKNVMEENNLSYRETFSIFSELGKEILMAGDYLISDEEMEKHEKFKAEGIEQPQLEVESTAWTEYFAYGLQIIGQMFKGIDFSKPFRIIVDYDPQRPRAIVRRFRTKEVQKSYSPSNEGKKKD